MLRRRLPRWVFVCVSLLAAGCAGPRPATSSDAGSPAEPHGARFAIVDQRDQPHHGIARLDLPAGTLTPVYTAEGFSRVHQLAASADGSFLVFAYTPPPGPGQGFMDRSGLYRLDLDGGIAEPRPVLAADEPELFHLEPALSPDGAYLFYVKVRGRYDTAVRSYATTLERLDLATAETRVIAPDGIWPRVSPDGTRLTFIAVHPQTQQRGLFVSGLDGSGLKLLVPIGRFFDIDTPVFSPDSREIYFSVAERAPRVSWLDQLLGVAYAHTDHNVPSDWWRIPVVGGAPERLTDRKLIIVHGAFDATGDVLAFSTPNGVFQLTRRGARLFRASDAPHFGTLAAWPAGS